MSRKLTLDINFINQPIDGDKFGYQISNNGVPLSFNGFEGWDKTFKESGDYSTANASIMSFEYDLNPNITDNEAIGNGFNGPVHFIKIQSSGKYICTGDFTIYQGQFIKNICRLNTDFTLDTTFIPPFYSSIINAIEIDSSDRIYLGVNRLIGSDVKRMERLSVDGTYDSSYITGVGFNSDVTTFKFQPDGKLIVGGSFTTFNGTTTKGLTRFTTATTATKDTTFNGITTGFSGFDYIRSIDLQSSGNIVVGGDFVSYNSTTCGNIIILTSTGAIANVPVALSNIPGVIVGNVVNKVLVDSSDKIYATGKFEIYGGNACHKIIRLNSNGTYDSTFAVVNDGLKDGSSVYSTGGYDMIFNSSDNLVVVGSFTLLQNVTVPNIGVLGSTGSISPEGESTEGTLSYYTDVIIREIIDTGSGYIIVGDFDSYSTPNVVSIPSQFIIPVGPTIEDTIQNTYDNLLLFNTGYSIVYTLFTDKITMEYTFDDQEIVINNLYDTPDYVEITFVNESLTLPELVDEIVVRSPYLIISNTATFSYVNYKVRVYEGSIFTGPSQSITYNITKSKLFDGQENIYVNLNNLIREKLQADSKTFVDYQYENAQPLPENMSKWCLVDETIFNGSVTASTAKYYLLALDGFLYNNEEQGVPNVLITGTKRYIHRNQAQRIYFQSNFLTDIKVSMDSNGTFNTLSFDSTDILGDNKKYIQSLQVDTQYFTNDNQHVDYLFTYSNSDMVIVRFEIYEDCKYKLYNVVYKNKWGVLESIPFSKKSTRGIDVKGVDFERSILDYNGNYDITRHTSKQFNVNASESWVLNTDWMPEYMNAAFEELGLSEEIWIITDTNEIIPVIKEDTRIDFKTVLNDKLIQYTLKVKLSHQVIKNIL